MERLGITYQCLGVAALPQTLHRELILAGPYSEHQVVLELGISMVAQSPDLVRVGDDLGPCRVFSLVVDAPGVVGAQLQDIRAGEAAPGGGKLVNKILAAVNDSPVEFGLVGIFRVAGDKVRRERCLLDCADIHLQPENVLDLGL